MSINALLKRIFVSFLIGCMLVTTPLIVVANQFSTDLTTESVALADDSAIQNSGGAPELIPGLPLAADLVAYHRRGNNDRLFALDTAVNLPGDILALKGDVVSYDGVNFSIIWAAAANGLTGGVLTDAITEINGKLILSFDTTVTFGDISPNDEDLVSFDGDTPTIYLDGSSINIDQSLDLDAVTYIDVAGGQLFMSFDTSGQIDGITFNDEDVLVYDLAEESWRLYFSGASRYANADIDAFYAILEIFSDGFE